MKKILTILILFPFFLHSQIKFETQEVYNQGNNMSISNIYNFIDIDGDTDLDILNGTGSWSENLDGNGAYSFFKRFENYYEHTEIVRVHDVDNDGDDDIIVFVDAGIDEQIIILENENSNFTPIPNTITVRVDDFKLTDVDNDGFDDIIAYILDNDSSNQNDYAENLLVYYKNDGQGNFEDYTLIYNTSENGFSPLYRGFVLDDYNKDGYIDVLFSEANGFYVLEHKNLVWELKNIINEELCSNCFLGIADLNNDGFSDIISKSSSNQYLLVWYKNLGNGVYSNSIIIDENRFYNNFIQSTTIDDYFVDYDKDGDIDILVFSSHEFGWLENIDSQGNFGEFNSLLKDNNHYYYTLALGDVDNDEDNDVLVSLNGLSFEESHLYKSNSNGFEDQQIYFRPYEEISQLLFDDIDNDGDQDVLCNNGNLFWLENTDGQGAFDVSHFIETDDFVMKWSHIYSKSFTTCLVDVNNDDAKDIIAIVEDNVTSSSYNIILKKAVFENRGSFLEDEILFEGELSGNARMKPNVLRSIDLDNDGDKDIVTVFEFDEEVYPYQDGTNEDEGILIAWFENLNGNGTFSDLKELYREDYNINLNNPPFLYVNDIDLDGRDDLLVIFRTNLRILLNQGNNEFKIQEIEVPEERNYRYEVVISDIDSDEDKDLILINNTFASSGMVFKNTNMNFEVETTDSDLRSSSSVILVDLDNDGDDDLVLDKTNKLLWKENVEGVYLEPKTILLDLEIENIRSHNATDIDGDGDMDILMANKYLYDDDYVRGQIRLFRNLGTTTTNEVLGKIYYDVNFDGCESKEFVLEDILITAESDDDKYSTFSQKTGHYQIYTTVGDYNITPRLKHAEYYSITPSPIRLEFSDHGNKYINKDLCVRLAEIQDDVSVTLFPLTEARPGFESSYKLIFKNKGANYVNYQQFLNKGRIVLTYDNERIEFLSSDLEMVQEAENTLTYSYSDFTPFSSREINLNFKSFIPPINNLGDELVFNVEIISETEDIDEVDNFFELNQTIVNSYDPNDITVLEGEQILMEQKDEYLHYIIRFQNTGSASAINVKIDNEIDVDLDLETLEIEDYSHTTVINIDEGRFLSFNFDNINLPDNTSNEIESNGFVAYKIKPMSNVDVGSIFKSKANIYFDFNAPIQTNEVSTEIVDVLNTDDIKLDEFIIFPNPAKDRLSFKDYFDVKDVEIFNQMGQRVLSKRMISKEGLEISSLISGIYFLKISDVNNRTNKIIKFIKK